MPRLSRGCFLHQQGGTLLYATGAVSGSRTHSLLLPKQAHYHLCYDDLSNLLGAAGSEKADPFWQWRRWGTYPSPATGFRYFYPHSLSGETALIDWQEISWLFRYGWRYQHTVCTSCGFAHPLVRCGSSFWCRSKQLQQMQPKELPPNTME